MITTSAAAPLEYQIPDRCFTASLMRLSPEIRGLMRGASREYRGALFSGPTGTGKTYALVAQLREHDSRTQDPPLFVDWPEFIGDIDRWKAMKEVDRDRFEPMKRLCEWRGPLFVDDVGQEHRVASGYRQGESEAIFDQFINRRTGAHYSLWITSNLSIADLRQRYGERTSSRLSEHCLLIGMGGDDRRLAVV